MAKLELECYAVSTDESAGTVDTELDAEVQMYGIEYLFRQYYFFLFVVI